MSRSSEGERGRAEGGMSIKKFWGRKRGTEWGDMELADPTVHYGRTVQYGWILKGSQKIRVVETGKGDRDQSCK